MKLTKQNRLQITIIYVFFIATLLGCYKETPIKVKADFSTSFVKEDESVPVQISIQNKTKNADTYQWTFEGGEPASSTEQNPGSITYKLPGTYILKLRATNIDDEVDTITRKIKIVDAININFTTHILQSNNAPVEVAIKNKTQGVGLTYHWLFEEANTVTSNDKHPDNIIFKKPGNHTIKLSVSNGFETFSKTNTITVAPYIQADFDWKVNFFDDDYQVPVTVQLNSTTMSTDTYKWTIEGATTQTDNTPNPQITFNKVGQHKINLQVSNDKQTKTVQKSITIHPNTNLRVFENIALGINAVHNTNIKGAFFSTELRKTFTAEEVTPENGNKIDIAFLSLNNSFNYNKFVSPQKVDVNGFIAIPNATHTQFINSQEICECGVSFTPKQFTAMKNDKPLQQLVIKETKKGLLHFTNSVVPRVVLFKTADNRKGAILIKKYIKKNNESHIVCDIKVQKLAN